MRSVGAGDICLLANLGLALVGEGEATLDGERLPSAVALERAGVEPIELGPKDGLAILSSSAVSIAAAALALNDAIVLLCAAQVAAALSMEGFRANLTPLDPRAAAARPAPGQERAADELRALLAGGELMEDGAARRLQDPLSFRTVSQVHGSLKTALGWLEDALEPELSGAADNPLVLPDAQEIISTGNFHVPALSLALDPSVGAAGVEDDSTGALAGALRLREQLEALRLLLALELVIAAQAIDLRRSAVRLGHGTAEVYAWVRERAAPLDEDGPLGPDVERVAEGLLGGIPGAPPERARPDR